MASGRTEPSPSELQRFRNIVGRQLGLSFPDDRLGSLSDALRMRLAASGTSAAAYLERLESASHTGEALQIARHLTVSETYFFRNREQFRVFDECVLGRWLRSGHEFGPLRVLSAACASGEEAYSIVIKARESDLGPHDVVVRAVDVNSAMIERAKRGRYSTWALRETPRELKDRWFHEKDREFVIDDSVRTSVSFAVANLAHEEPDLFTPDSYDAVFCRNVMMYLTKETVEGLVSQIARALRPGGYLFLGHAETLRGVRTDLQLQHSHDTFYYRRVAAADAPHAIGSRLFSTAPFDDASFSADASRSWVDTIRDSAERIGSLATQPDTLMTAPGAVLPPASDLTSVFALVRDERFAEALEQVRTLPAEAARDAQVLLLEAMLLLHTGELVEARERCEQLLLSAELSAGAHYVLALCHEAESDRAAAFEHHRVAAYLDPAFAMPRLHLGILARKAGDREGAQRELAQARLLLQREDAMRLLLFGGGFRRDALLALCTAELRSAGGSS